VIDDQATAIAGVGPVLMGGMAFDAGNHTMGAWDGFPDAMFFVPRIQVVVNGDERWLTINALVDPDGNVDVDPGDVSRMRFSITSPVESEISTSRTPDAGDITYSDALDAGEWRELVGDAVDAIHNGEFDKVVLAREVRATAPSELSAVAALRQMRRAHRDSYVFGIWSGATAFIGASPERLVRLDGREVSASSLAGSVRRGATPAEDSSLAEGLLSSAKDREEHEVVRKALTSALATLCDDVTAADSTSILSLPQVHHLHTAVSARLREGHSLLDLVAKLHPTPAVGGEPRNAALDFIRNNEKLDRGWYAAPIGWLQRDRGEFAVALRSALINGNTASLFAGCGIVADSDPDEEFAESILKLRPMQLALAASLRGSDS
jgi:isochorismate synthase